ncbi:MAG TPA: hypothetical protein VJK02_21240 [Anaerolineales bacterium]|nr:hypothetical protein [Anaerolineales bacterium]
MKRKHVTHYSTLGLVICTNREPGPRQHAVWGNMRVTCKKCRDILGLPQRSKEAGG